MKKFLFAVEVFGVIALFIAYLILELNHTPDEQPNTTPYVPITVEKSNPISQESLTINWQTLSHPYSNGLSITCIAPFLKTPSQS